ncbi:MAG TPA: MFS transporter [Sphingobium sp.]|nr:MFS transporter [Sphingobium sp.]
MAIHYEKALSAGRLRPFQWATFLVCMLVLIGDGIDLQLLGLVAPVIIADWGVDRGSFGWAMSAALVGMGLGAWIGGTVGDRIGRRNALAGAALVFGLATLAASTADTLVEMTAYRLVGGLGFGAAFPNSLALASEWLPERWRSYAITTLSVGTPAGGAVAAALAPDLLAAYGWRGTFVVFGASTLLLIVLILGILKDSPPFLAAKGQQARARKFARKVTDEELIFDAPKAQEASPETAPSTDIGVFHATNRRLNSGVSIGFAASTLVAYGVISWGTTFLTAAGLTLEQALTTSFAVGITSIAGALAAGFLARHFGSKAVMLGVSIVLLVLVVAAGAMVEVFRVSPSPAVRLAIQALIASISGIVSVGIATIYVMMTLGYSQSCRSAGIGFGMMTGRLGAIVASFGGGFLIDLGNGSLVPFFIAMAIGAILVSAAAFIVDIHVQPARVQARALAG